MLKVKRLKHNLILFIFILVAILSLVGERNKSFAQTIIRKAVMISEKPVLLKTSALETFVSDSLEINELSLRDVIDIALSNSLDIQIAKFDAYISRLSLKKDLSIFDAFLNAYVDYNRDKRMQSSTVYGTETKSHEFSAGIEKKFSTGTTISLDAIGTKNRTNSIYSTLNPYNEAVIGVSITQELGQNFFGIEDRSNIKVTKIDIRNSEFTSLDDIEAAIADVGKAYWDFVLGEEVLAITTKMHKEALQLYEVYKKRHTLGVLEDSEFLAIEALVYERENDVTLARLERDTAKNNLLFLINKGDFRQVIRPKEKLVFSNDAINFALSLNEAIEHRRDYKRKLNNVEKNELDLVIKKNALWPSIDLEATLNRNNLNFGRGQAWRDVAKQSNDEVYVGLTFKMSLENREAKAELEQTKIEKKKILLELKRVERLILQDINDKTNKVHAIQVRAKLYQKTVKLHEEKLEFQIKRMRAGRSNSDILIRYEEDLLLARLNLITSLSNYEKSLIDLELAQNTLLNKYWKEPL